jgi:hypothetical protein
LSCPGEPCGVRVIPAVDVAAVHVKAAPRVMAYWHAPDFLLRCGDGSALVVDYCPDARLSQTSGNRLNRAW